jgi:ATP-dependent Lhr-like helicase
MRRILPADAREVGALDAGAIERVCEEAWPVVRDAEELHDALLTLIVLPVVPAWAGLFDELARQRRATTLRAGPAALWVAAERQAPARAVLPDVRPDPPLDAVSGGSTPAEGPAWTRDSAATEVLRGWLESMGPTTAPELASRLSLDLEAVETGLARLESEGQILRGRFRPLAVPANGSVEWCNRRLLARIHRLTIGRLRREIEPVTSAEFVRFLFRWQHVAPGTQLHGVEGTLAVLEQLQGYEVAAAAWERDVLARRVANYSPEFLDRLCLSGDVMWGRLSPHPLFDAAEAVRGPDSTREPIRPTRVAPISIFLREDAEWLLGTAEAPPRSAHQPPGPTCPHRGQDLERLSASARVVLEALARRGASFQSELAAATALPPRDVEEALWELSATGMVTGDGFENLRALIDPARRRGMGVVRFRRGQRRAGRWALLSSPSGAPASDDRRADAFARQLLSRWGVVFKDVVAREGLMPSWRSVLQALRRMEARGEVRGGRFVSGHVGEQFAEPAAVDALRAGRRPGQPAAAQRVAAADPLNLVGILTPGPRVSPLSGQTVEVLPDPANEGAVTQPARSASSL